MKRLKSKPMLLLACIVQFAAVGALDYITGYEVRIGALYAVPIAFATWYLGGWIGAVAGLSATAIAFWVERAGGKVYQAEWIAYANGVSRLSIFLFVAFSFSYFRRAIASAENRVQALSGPLPVCARCHRVSGGGGFWMDYPTYLRKNSEAVPEYHTCPICTAAGETAPDSSPPL